MPSGPPRRPVQLVRPRVRRMHRRRVRRHREAERVVVPADRVGRARIDLLADLEGEPLHLVREGDQRLASVRLIEEERHRHRDRVAPFARADVARLSPSGPVAVEETNWNPVGMLTSFTVCVPAGTSCGGEQ